MMKATLAAILAGLLGVGTAMASPARGAQRRAPQTPMGRLAMANAGRAMTLRAELNLTEEQREEIKAIIEKRRPEMQPVVRKVVDKKRALREAVLAETPDERAIRRAADELGKAAGEVSVLASRIAGEIRPILTPEQIEKLEKFSEERDSSVDRWLDEIGR